MPQIPFPVNGSSAERGIGIRGLVFLEGYGCFSFGGADNTKGSQMKPQPTLPTTIPTICLRAAEVLRERGWTQRLAVADDGRVCAMGAIWVAMGADLREGVFNQNGASADTVIEVENAFRKAMNCDQFVARWNDEPGRTVENVIAGFEATAWANALTIPVTETV